MQQIIMITGATDGIGLETSKTLAAEGHQLILHGRSQQKLDGLLAQLPGSPVGYLADMADLSAVAAMAQRILAKHDRLDVLINNAGVFKMRDASTAYGIDARFIVNSFAPLILARKLSALLGTEGRIVNLSSAAQDTVDPAALSGEINLSDMGAYAQSKLAITIWTAVLAKEAAMPKLFAVNPGSLLASKMVKEGFGVAGHDLSIGVDILIRAALSEEFTDKNGQYFDNDSGQFSLPHPGGQDSATNQRLVDMMESIIRDIDPALLP